MRIAVDAMGTDRYPVPDIEGSVMAARELDVEIILVGDSEQIGSVLSKLETASLPITVEHASQVIKMTDKPSEAMRAKTDSSMHRGMLLV